MITIDKEYGDKIISFYASQDSQNNVIHVQVEFSINRPDDRVEYDIWLSSANDKGLQFVQDFYRLHRRFKSDVLFQPRYFTWNCPSCSSEVKERDCLYDGKYCSFSDYSNGEKGSNIILENLRQKCIFLFAKFNGNERKWWEYILTRNRLIQESSICFDKYSEKCSLEVHKKISISWDDTVNCVNKSLNENNKEENRYLKEDQELWIKLNLHTIPMVVINDQPYFGELDPVNVFKTLCNSFLHIPKECTSFKQEEYNIAMSASLIFLVLIILAIIINLIVIVYLRIKAKRELREEIDVEVHQVIQKYMKVKTNDESNDDSKNM